MSSESNVSPLRRKSKPAICFLMEVVMAVFFVKVQPPNRCFQPKCGEVRKINDKGGFFYFEAF
jgi:hypothetical protein